MQTVYLAIIILFSVSFAQAQTVGVFGSWQTAFAPWDHSGLDLVWVGAGAGTCQGGENEIQAFPDDVKVAVIEWATMDLVEGVSVKEHIGCLAYLVSYIRDNIPNVTRIVIVNAPPSKQGNSFPLGVGQITSTAVAVYNAAYAQFAANLADEFPGYVKLAEMRGIMWPVSGYARVPYMNGKYGITFGARDSNNWDYFFNQIKGAMN